MQRHHLKNYNRITQRTSVWHVCLCWLLCLSVWRGPVPVIHEHSLDLLSLANNVRLAEHAIIYHPTCLGDEDTGLHFHFMLPDQTFDSLANSNFASQQDFGAVDSILKLDQQTRICLDLNAARLQTTQLGPLAITEDLRFSSTANDSFLQTQISSTPALAVLCVCLC